MAVRPVLRIGHLLLRQQAQPVRAFQMPELCALIHDLRDTMLARDGAGLAAPQIGISLRVVVFAVTANSRYPEAPLIPETVLINPRLTALTEQRSSAWEGCLSVPGLRGLVPRYRQIRYQGFNEAGTAIDRVVAGFHARVVQHECDHLDGVLYPDRIEDRTAFGFLDELAASGVLPELPQE